MRRSLTLASPHVVLLRGSALIALSRVLFQEFWGLQRLNISFPSNHSALNADEDEDERHNKMFDTRINRSIKGRVEKVSPEYWSRKNIGCVRREEPIINKLTNVWTSPHITSTWNFFPIIAKIRAWERRILGKINKCQKYQTKKPKFWLKTLLWNSTT